MKFNNNIERTFTTTLKIMKHNLLNFILSISNNYYWPWLVITYTNLGEANP